MEQDADSVGAHIGIRWLHRSVSHSSMSGQGNGSLVEHLLDRAATLLWSAFSPVMRERSAGTISRNLDFPTCSQTSTRSLAQHIGDVRKDDIAQGADVRELSDGNAVLCRKSGQVGKAIGMNADETFLFDLANDGAAGNDGG